MKGAYWGGTRRKTKNNNAMEGIRMPRKNAKLSYKE